MEISYDWYRVFYWAARSESLTAAARRLYISQPAVSQRIRQLEDALGCRLFSRTAKGVTLTAEGETLYRDVCAGIERIRLGEQRLRAQMNLESGEIHIGASDMTLAFFLLPHLERFNELYPGIRIHITNGPTPETLRMLAQERIDFCAISEPVAGGDFSITPVKPIEDIFVCGQSFAHLTGRPVPLSELSELPLILLEANTSTRTYIDGILSRHGVSVDPAFELATSSLIVQFARRNLGIGCVVADFAAEDIERGLIYRIETLEAIEPRHICIARGRRATSKAAERLLAMVLEETPVSARPNLL